MLICDRLFEGPVRNGNRMRSDVMVHANCELISKANNNGTYVGSFERYYLQWNHSHDSLIGGCTCDRTTDQPQADPGVSLLVLSYS